MTSIADVNSRLKKTSIKGKDYIDVAQRVQGFREVFPDGSIVTDFTIIERDWCVCKASVIVSGAVLATGTAFEEKKGSINTTSYVENCETSAVGRALGFLGIGSVDRIASADEMVSAENASKAAEEPSKATKAPAPTIDRWAKVRALKEEALSLGAVTATDIANGLKAAIGKDAKEYNAADIAHAENYLLGIIEMSKEAIE